MRQRESAELANVLNTTEHVVKSDAVCAQSNLLSATVRNGAPMPELVQFWRYWKNKAKNLF